MGGPLGEFFGGMAEGTHAGVDSTFNAVKKGLEGAPPETNEPLDAASDGTKASLDGTVSATTESLRGAAHATKEGLENMAHELNKHIFDTEDSFGAFLDGCGKATEEFVEELTNSEGFKGYVEVFKQGVMAVFEWVKEHPFETAIVLASIVMALAPAPVVASMLLKLVGFGTGGITAGQWLIPWHYVI